MDTQTHRTQQRSGNPRDQLFERMQAPNQANLSRKLPNVKVTIFSKETGQACDLKHGGSV